MIVAEVTHKHCSYENDMDMLEWCTQMFGKAALTRDNAEAGRQSWVAIFHHGYSSWHFAKEKDATLFALKWGST